MFLAGLEMEPVESETISFVPIESMLISNEEEGFMSEWATIDSLTNLDILLNDRHLIITK